MGIKCYTCYRDLPDLSDREFAVHITEGTKDKMVQTVYFFCSKDCFDKFNIKEASID